MKYFVYLIFILSGFQGLFAQEFVEKHESVVLGCYLKLDSVNTVLNQYVQDLDSVSAKIAVLKEGENLSYGKRRELDDLLKDAHTIAMLQEQTVVYHQGLVKEFGTYQQQADVFFTNSIDSLHALLAGSKISDSQRKKWVEQINMLMEKRTQINALMSVKQTSNSFGEPVVGPDDLPDEIDAKAEFFRDREDKYREKAKDLAKKFKDVQEEMELRQRMSDMVEDVRMFDQRDEAFAGRETKSAGIWFGGEKSNYLDNQWERNSDMYGISNTPLIREADKLLNFDFNSLPVYDAEEYLAKLSKEQNKLNTAADSMANIANQYEKQAEELRNSLSQPKE